MLQVPVVQTIGFNFIDDLLDKIKPDAVLTGDTYSCLAVIASKNKKIPTFHLEVGNRCFDMRVPEELIERLLIILLM